MRFNKWISVGIMTLALPTLVLAQAKINFDPAANTIGDGKSTKSLVSDSGSIEALQYLAGSRDPVTISIRLVNWLLGFLGLISMILLLYAGLIWFKARDNEEEITRAKQILKGSLTGLVITLLAYGLAQLLFSQLIRATTSV